MNQEVKTNMKVYNFQIWIEDMCFSNKLEKIKADEEPW